MTCGADAAAKFRLAAHLVADQGGVYVEERAVVAAAVEGLQGLRAG